MRDCAAPEGMRCFGRSVPQKGSHMIRVLLLCGLVAFWFACASTPETQPPPTPPPPVAKPAPPPPAPVYEPPPPQVRELPKTASSLPALGLAGLVALAGAGILRGVRKRIR